MSDTICLHILDNVMLQGILFLAEILNGFPLSLIEAPLTLLSNDEPLACHLIMMSLLLENPVNDENDDNFI